MDFAHSVAVLDSVDSARPADRAVADREDDGIALIERDHLRPRLATGPLLGEDELAAGKIGGVRKKGGDLEREDMLAVHVLMEAIVIARAVAQDQRGRATLA